MLSRTVSRFKPFNHYYMSFESLAIEDTLLSIMVRFIVNLAVLFILIRLIYYRFTKKEEYVFSFS